MNYLISNYAFYKGNEAEKIRTASDEEQIAFLNEHYSNVYSELKEMSESYVEAINTGTIKTNSYGDTHKGSLKKWATNYNKNHEGRKLTVSDNGELIVTGIKRQRYIGADGIWYVRGDSSMYSSLVQAIIEEAITLAIDEERKYYIENDENALLYIELNKLICSKGNMGLPLKQRKNSNLILQEELPPFYENDGKEISLSAEQAKFLINRYKEKDEMIKIFHDKTKEMLNI